MLDSGLFISSHFVRHLLSGDHPLLGQDTILVGLGLLLLLLDQRLDSASLGLVLILLVVLHIPLHLLFFLNG